MNKYHIDVCSALRESASRSYSNLVTRPTGVAVRTYIERQLSSSDDSAVIIDFTHVGMMDFSCADEIVAKLVLRDDRVVDGAADTQHPKLMFSGLSESHLEAIDAVLERHGLSLVSYDADGNSQSNAPSNTSSNTSSNASSSAHGGTTYVVAYTH